MDTVHMNYKEEARKARVAVLNMLFDAQTSHIGSNFSCIDIMTVLFKGVMTPDDKFILSKGWAAASLYYFLAETGVIPKSDLDTYCKKVPCECTTTGAVYKNCSSCNMTREVQSKYIGLAEPYVDGVEAGAGSMGHGLPMAVGMALAKKMKGEPGRVFVLMSDGEMQCGTTWESALLAMHHSLGNLTVIVDNNKWQAMGRVEDILPLEPLGDKWRAFGWSTSRIKGHDHDILETSLSLWANRPYVVIADTIKGKGVSFMEEDGLLYHYKNINEDEYERAVVELVK